MLRSRLLGGIAGLAIGLGSGLVAVPFAPPAQAEEVQKLRPEVGVPLQKAQELLKAALGKGFRTLADDGVRRVLDGATAMDELLRVIDLTDRM